MTRALDRNTIHEAARRAGVSVASVSRALNNKPGIGPETRQRILDICAELGYQPSAAARQLKEGRTATVGLSMGMRDWQINPYVSLVFEHLTTHLQTRGLTPRLYHHSDMEQMIAETASAVLLGVEADDSRVHALQAARIPFVSIGQRLDGFWICPDDFAGGVLAAEALLQAGCTRLAMIEIDSQGKGTGLRAKGFHETIGNADQTADICWVPDSDTPSLTAYRTLMREWQTTRPAYDGLFCETDEVALGVLKVLEDLNIRVPNQVRLVGYDDLPVFGQTLTTIRQDTNELVRGAVDLLIRAQQGSEPQAVIMPVQLVRRGTV